MTAYEKKRQTLNIKQRAILNKSLVKYFKEVKASIQSAIDDHSVEHFADNLPKYLLFDKYAEIIYASWGETGSVFAEITESNIKNQYYINQKRREPAKLNTGFFSQTYVDNMVRYAKTAAGEMITKVNETTILGRLVGSKLVDGKLVGGKRVGGVKNALIKAGEQRLGAKDTARLIKKEYAFSSARALTIARTETTAAAEAGSFIVAKSWNVAMTTTWVCAFKNSRDSHIHADGETVKLGEYFSVGGAKMKHPGDRSGGAGGSEVINCNCTTYNKVIQPPEPEEMPPAYKPMEREFSFSHLVSTLIGLFLGNENQNN